MEEVQLYSAQLLLIIEYLLYKEIIYQDIKPENMMLDTQGYLKLIDFGSARFISESS